MYIYVLIYVRYCIIYDTHEHVLLIVNKVFSIIFHHKKKITNFHLKITILQPCGRADLYNSLNFNNSKNDS